ncbi:hypothetical protein [Maricaulis sp.]|nr:hypothetical protein [Maricaulis sp.]
MRLQRKGALLHGLPSRHPMRGANNFHSATLGEVRGAVVGESVECPICEGRFFGRCYEHSSDIDGRAFECDACGRFTLSRTALSVRVRSLNSVERAAISHRIQIAQSENYIPRITTSWFDDDSVELRLPSPIERARNLIEVVGLHVLSNGSHLSELSPRDFSKIGFFDFLDAENIFRETSSRNLLKGQLVPDSDGDFYHLSELNLTLDGWEEFEELRSGLRAGKYAFVAMKFGDLELEVLVSTFVKPKVLSELGYQVVDLRDVARAGIIDNLLREQIRDAAFVIVDLTHDNSGAYWEAGYAEGLGKPVVYICESAKFDAAKTHFDTNHCMTVVWSKGKEEEFSRSLIATIRRSLGLFPTQ